MDCNITINVYGGVPESRDMFLEALSQEGDIWIGSGIKNASAHIAGTGDSELTVITGTIRNSIRTALYSDAESLRTQQKYGQGSWEWTKLMDSFEFMDLSEACEHFGVSVYAVSRNPYSCISEEFLVSSRGKVESQKTCNYQVVSLNGITDYGEFLQMYPEFTPVTNKKMFEEAVPNGVVEVGGFISGGKLNR